MLDVSGDVEIKKKIMKTSKPLRADEIIAQRSAVPAVSMRKRPSKTTDGVIEAKRQRTAYVSHKEVSRLRNIIKGKTEDQVVEVTDATFDPWAEDPKQVAAQSDPRFTFLPKPKPVVAPSTLKHEPISLAASGKKVAAVSKPQGGYSYNPVYTEYEARLIAAGEKEVQAEKKRLAQLEAEQVKLEAAARSAEEAIAAEKKAELSEWDEESAWEGLESEAENEVSKLKAKRPERKSLVQRNRIKRRKEEERRQKMLADIKKRNIQAEKIKEIAKALEEREIAKKMQLETAKAAEDQDEEAIEELELRRRKLGKIKLPEKELELVLPDELAESLRLLKPEGNALKERYRSLLVRGKVEARARKPFHKQAKRKMTEKWTYKDFNLV
jgi:nucleolar protein 53